MERNGSVMIKKNRKPFVISAFFVLAIAIFSFILYNFVAKSQREHRIFCGNNLTSATNKTNALNYLQQFGDITYSLSKTGDSTEVIYVGYLNKKITGDKMYVLYFSEDRYEKVRALPTFWDFQEFGTTIAMCQE